MLKKFLLIITIGISLIAMTDTEVKAWSFKPNFDFTWGSYTGCYEIAGGGPDFIDVTVQGNFLPTDAFLVAMNNAGHDSLVGIGHARGVDTTAQPADFIVDENGRMFVCIDVAAFADECDDPDPVVPGTIFDRNIVDTQAYPECVDYLPHSDPPYTPEELSDAFLAYWGIDPDVLKNNETAYSLEIGSIVAAGTILTTRSPDPADTESFSCLTTENYRTWSDPEYTCVLTGLPIGIYDSYTLKRNREVLTVNARNGVLDNDVDTAGDDPLTVAEVNGSPLGEPIETEDGTLTVDVDGSFIFQRAEGFTGLYSFTYKPSDGTTPNRSNLTDAYINAL
jgi:hypothetical protein